MKKSRNMILTAALLSAVLAGCGGKAHTFVVSYDTGTSLSLITVDEGFENVSVNNNEVSFTVKKDGTYHIQAETQDEQNILITVEYEDGKVEVEDDSELQYQVSEAE